MQKNIWAPLGAKNSTFFPTSFFSDSNPISSEIETMHRNPETGSLSPGSSIWPRECKDALGGAGIWSTPTDFGKLLVCLLRGGNPLLKPESVEELFRPQLGDNSLEGLKRFCDYSMGSLWDSPPALRVQINHSLAGTVNTEDVKGRRAAGTVNWGGLPCMSWFVFPH
jgi:CubicO group peptidase (beta-lactamase class C family)